MSTTVDIPQSLKDSLRKFRFARRKGGNAALVVKINKKELVMEEVEQFALRRKSVGNPKAKR